MVPSVSLLAPLITGMGKNKGFVFSRTSRYSKIGIVGNALNGNVSESEEKKSILTNCICLKSNTMKPKGFRRHHVAVRHFSTNGFLSS